jgi:hypothetical protein
MKFICFSVIGVVVQSASLTVFILVSRTKFADQGKPLVLGATALAMALLLWIWVRDEGYAVSLFLAPAALAVGFSASYHLVGALCFPGLLNDFYAPFLDYFLSVLRVTANVFLIYWIVAAVFFVLIRVWQKMTPKSSDPLIKPSRTDGGNPP